MKVKKSEAVELFQAAGYGKADSWDNERLADKISKMRELLPKEKVEELEDEKLQKLARSLKKELREDEPDIELIDDSKTKKKAKVEDEDEDYDENDEANDDEDESDEDEDEEPKKKKKRGPGRPKGSKNKKKAAAKDEDDEDDDEDEDEDEDEDKAPKKRKPGRPKGSGKKKADEDDEDDEEETPKKKAKKKAKEINRTKGGVIRFIREKLEKAGEKDKPIKENRIREMLEEKFPKRDIDSMWVTFRSQVPKRFRDVRKIRVVGSRKTGWMIKPGAPKKGDIQVAKRGRPKKIRDDDED